MWALMLPFFLYLFSFAPALSSPINQNSNDPVNQLDVRNIDPGDDTVLTTPKPLAKPPKPSVPYDWPIPGATGAHIKILRYGAEVPESDGYLFGLRVENELLRIIHDQGREKRLQSKHSWTFEHCSLEVIMAKEVKAGELLKWITGFWKFMKKYGYVEADMIFETFYPYQDVGTARFRLSDMAHE
ncbi:MAG: hypothetical protein Q9225_007720 [Loekoesia sp. 1 TL-2023]